MFQKDIHNKNKKTVLFIGLFFVLSVFLVTKLAHVSHYHQYVQVKQVASNFTHDKQRHFLKLPQQVTFFNKGYLINYFKTINPRSKVIIDGTINKTINKDAKDVISNFITNSTKRDIDVGVINVIDENTQEYI